MHFTILEQVVQHGQHVPLSLNNAENVTFKLTLKIGILMHWFSSVK